jgi:hypothetical protein
MFTPIRWVAASHTELDNNDDFERIDSYIRTSVDEQTHPVARKIANRVIRLQPMSTWTVRQIDTITAAPQKKRRAGTLPLS